MIQKDIWDDAYRKGRRYLTLEQQQIEMLLAFIDKPYEDKTVLDLGCGTGHLTRQLQDYSFSRIVGVDNSEVALNIAWSLDENQTISYAKVNLETQFSKQLNEKFDLVVCKDTLAFIEEKNDFYEETRKCMKSNGIFIIISPKRTIVQSDKIYITLDSITTKNQLSDYFKVDKFYSDSLEEYYICRQLNLT